MNLIFSKKRKRSKFIQKDYLGNLYCYKCKEYNSINDYDNSPQESDIFYRDGRDKRCKKCKKEQYNKRRINNRGKLSLDRLLLERWHAVKDRALKNNLELDFNVDFLKNLWKIQNGKCAISGIEMTYIMFKGRVFTNVSVDRIDSNLSYVKNNVQLVCMAVNQMKNELTLDELLYFCNNIINFNNENKN